MESMRGGTPDRYGMMSINVRLPPDCYSFLVTLARAEHRSLGAQCSLLLERMVDSLANPAAEQT